MRFIVIGSLVLALAMSFMPEALATCRNKVFHATVIHKNEQQARTMVAQRLHNQAKLWCTAKCKLSPARDQIISCTANKIGQLYTCNGKQTFTCCCEPVCTTTTIRAEVRNRDRDLAYKQTGLLIGNRAVAWCRNGKLTPYRNRIIRCSQIQPNIWLCKGSQTFSCCR
jgi:hypothetical protein